MIKSNPDNSIKLKPQLDFRGPPPVGWTSWDIWYLKEIKKAQEWLAEELQQMDRIYRSE